MPDVIQFGSSDFAIHLWNCQLIAPVMIPNSHNPADIGHIKNRSPREAMSCTQMDD